jgi:hypothetical protein
MFITGWSDKEGNTISYHPLGMFTSPDGKGFSNMPYTKDQRKVAKVHDRFEMIFDKVKAHLSRTDRSIVEEINLIKTKKSTLPKYCRDWLLNA